MKQRAGLGFDLHRCGAPRPLVLGGVVVDEQRGLIAHSDGDVVLHALCDALLGAAALGDIGELFPDTDPRYKDADSRTLLGHVLERVQQSGYRVGNVDVIIHAQQPRLTPHKPRIRAALAQQLGVPIDLVNVKAKTNEGVDAVGRGEAIACSVIVLLDSING